MRSPALGDVGAWLRSPEPSSQRATVALNLFENLRLVIICVSCLQGWIHLSTQSKFAGPLQGQRRQWLLISDKTLMRMLTS